MTHPIPMEQRFWSRVDQSGGPDACWEWTGGKGHGYGALPKPGHGAGHVLAHRYSYELAHGPIPPGMFVCHQCDNPGCVNPAHLFLGTCQDNLRDMYAKHRDVNHTHPDCKAKGDKNGSRVHPECILKGERHPMAKLTEQDVLAIRAARVSGRTLNSIAAEYGVTNVLIRYIVIRRIWKHI